MRRPFIAGNWKMHLDRTAARQLAADLATSLKGIRDRDIALFPAFPLIPAVAAALEESPIQVGGQNLWFETEGAFTGEVSGPMLRSVGAVHVLVGHSERRHILGESDDWISLKMAAALASNLNPILCVGETLEEREGGLTEEVLSRQIRSGLGRVAADAMARVTVAYEPVWAIGTGKTATPETANAAHAFIRSEVEDLFQVSVSRELRIQYGGSVKPGNVDGLMAMPDIDGALVGGASLTADDFTRIVNFETRT
ncbi:MAG TPA: triose-phosphate isomerase [Planctomycetes bacterium]|nr:triose-phosphate isomerase [Planctomycetota bacterium]